MGDPETVQERGEAGPLLGHVDGLDLGAEQGDSRGRQGSGQVQGGLAPELHEGGERPHPGSVVLGPDHR